MKKMALPLGLAALLVAACDPSEGLAKQYDDPQYPCRKDAMVDEAFALCWQRCQAQLVWDEEMQGCVNDPDDYPDGSTIDWGKTFDYGDAVEECDGTSNAEGLDFNYYLPEYEEILSLLDGCELDLSGVDGGVADAGADAGVPPNTPTDCKSCEQSAECHRIYTNSVAARSVYWTKTRCPTDDDLAGNIGEEDWHGRWVVDFETGRSECAKTSTSSCSAICVHTAPDPWPPENPPS